MPFKVATIELYSVTMARVKVLTLVLWTNLSEFKEALGPEYC